MTALEDNPLHRMGALTGRAQALAEVMAMVRRLSERIHEDASEVEALQTLILAWSELITWLEQAGDEAGQEVVVLRGELSSPATGACSGPAEGAA
jgi:hypothetical protein